MFYSTRGELIFFIIVLVVCSLSVTVIPFLRQEYLKFTDSEYRNVADSEYGAVSLGLDPSDSVIEGLMDQIATERAARLVAEKRLRALQEENDRLRRWRQQ